MWLYSFLTRSLLNQYCTWEYPAPNDVSMLGQRLRRCASIETALGENVSCLLGWCETRLVCLIQYAALLCRAKSKCSISAYFPSICLLYKQADTAIWLCRAVLQCEGKQQYRVTNYLQRMHSECSKLYGRNLSMLKCITTDTQSWSVYKF